MKSLLAFYNDKDQKENVRNYLMEQLMEEGIERMFNKEDTTGIADAKIVIDKAFDNLEVLFNKKAEPKKPINEAR